MPGSLPKNDVENYCIVLSIKVLNSFQYLICIVCQWGKDYIVLHAVCSAQRSVFFATFCHFVLDRTHSSASEWGKLIPFNSDFLGGSCSLMKGHVICPPSEIIY